MPSMAATYTVTNLNDLGPGSLRDAVDQANLTVGVPDVIEFAAGVTGTIPLASPIVVTDPLTINGPAASLLTITPPATSIALLNSSDLAVSRVTFANGATTLAPVVNGLLPSPPYYSSFPATLTLQSCVFSNNLGSLVGAVINFPYSALSISDCTFSSNTANAAGAVANLGALNITNSTFSGNQADGAGAILSFSYGGSLNITNSTFSGNHAQDAGAVLSYSYGETLNITNSTFSGNQADDALGAGAILSVADSFVMTNSTISGNTGGVAGGIYLPYLVYTAEIRNSTLTGNVSSGPAGAIVAGDSGPIIPLRFRNLRSTITANARAALQALHLTIPPKNLKSTVAAKGRKTLRLAAAPATPTLNLTSTIAANSTSSSGTVDIARDVTNTINAANSLIRNAAGAVNGTNTANIFGVDPLLGPLQNNGGRTETHALLPGSPALDTGSNPLALATDQRGAGFARTSRSVTDIGAYELQEPRLIPTLSEWGTVVLAALLAGVTLLTGLRRRKRGG